MVNNKFRILIVDDIDENLKVLTETLTIEGFSPLQAKSGERAVEIAKKAVPDLILLDIKMPGMDGYETIAALKSDAITAQIPVIFLSALNQIEDKIKGFSCGAVDYISKPFQKEEVIARVTTHLNLQEAKREIEAEKQKSEKLLLNILPKKVAEDLKDKGKSEPDVFRDVSIFFSDFVNFTNNCGTLAPNALIEELNVMFTAFDDIMEKNGCERIKTVGDAYLAVCSISARKEDHARRMAQASLEILEFLSKRNEGKDMKWEVRIGLHCGDIVGGIVGTKKYIYDIFGDSVNVASRMENLSAPMKIKCTSLFAGKISGLFEFSPEEEVEVKGIGKMKTVELLGPVKK